MNAGRISQLLGIVFVLSSCGKTVVGDGFRISDAPTTVTLTVSDAAEEVQVARSTPFVGESWVKSLELWVFYAEGQTHAGSLARYVPAGEAQTTVTFVINGGVYDFYVVANQQVGSLETKSELLSKLSSRVIAPTDSRTVTSSGLPMVGASTAYALDGAQTAHRITMPLKRRAAKFEPPVAASGLKVRLADPSDLDAVLPGVVYDPESPNLDFNLTGFALVNGINKSWLFGAELRGTDWSLPSGATYQLSSFDAGGAYTGVYSGVVDFGPPPTYFLDPAAHDVEYIYAYENAPSSKTVDGVTGYDRNEVYAMIIRGTVSPTDDPSNIVTRYWRVNLVRGSASSPRNFSIEENKAYRIRINEIRSLGYATPQLAENEAGSLGLILPSGQASMTVTCHVADWDGVDEETIL